MLVNNPRNKLELTERTRFRNESLWVTTDWGGLLLPLVAEQGNMNLLSRNVIEGYIAQTDEIFFTKDYQINRQHEVAIAEVEQDGLIADEKAATERNKLALKMAGEALIHAARLYDAKVRAIIMDAKEYAAAVEREQVDIERRKAILAVAKEQNRLKQINAEIYMEYLNRAMVEADLAKAKLDAAKARVRAILADIEAQQADIKLIEAELAEAMAKADKATLVADVAMIWAEIVTKGLAQITFDVESLEIQKGFEWLQEKMAKMLTLWDTRVRIELYRAEAEEQIYQAVLALIAGELDAENIKLEAAHLEEGVFAHEVEKTEWGLDQERQIRDLEIEAKEELASYKNQIDIRKDNLQAWAKRIANAAHRWLNKHHVVVTSAAQDYKMYVQKG